MIISPGRKFIFVHIPKTGGTSLSLALEARAMKDDILIGDTPKAQRRKHRLRDIPAKGRLWKHARLADLDGFLSPRELAGYFVFTLVRDPWDRVASYYHWLRQQSFDHPAVDLAQSLEFSAFLAHPLTDAALRKDAAHLYVTDVAGAERCDAFVRLEHLARDLALVEAHLGFGLDLPHANRSGHRAGYRGDYSSGDAARVADIFAGDITRLGYSF